MQFRLFLGGAKHISDATVGESRREQATVELYVLENVSHSLLHKEACFFLVCRVCKANSVSDGGWKVRK